MTKKQRDSETKTYTNKGMAYGDNGPLFTKLLDAVDTFVHILIIKIMFSTSSRFDASKQTNSKHVT